MTDTSQDKPIKGMTIQDCMDAGPYSRTTVHRLIKSGKLKSIKIGSSRRVLQSSWNDLMSGSEAA